MKHQNDKLFSDEERRAIIQEYLDLGPGRWKNHISEKYGIRGHSTLNYWLERYTQDGQIIPETPEEKFRREMNSQQKKVVQKKKATNTSTCFPTEREVAKDKEILRLKMELEKERTRTLALNRMIDIAESELNISIRKKSGAKQ